MIFASIGAYENLPYLQAKSSTPKLLGRTWGETSTCAFVVALRPPGGSLRDEGAGIRAAFGENATQNALHAPRISVQWNGKKESVALV